MTTEQSTAEIADFALRPIREGADFVLYRGVERRSQKSVLGVADATNGLANGHLERLRHENSLAAELDPAWSARPLGIARHHGRSVLMLEDPGGEPLDHILERHLENPIDLSFFLKISIGAARALGDAHQRGIVHRDIRPENMLVGAERVWLTGFGLASLLPRERRPPIRPEAIAGTLAYMAPEQTGRLNRAIDARADLYSLGVTMYQLWSGVLPFQASDAMEWVHCHIARQPRPLLRPSSVLPDPIIAIIMKLLAKPSEDRFQTARGLEHDLRRCLAEWEHGGRIDAFVLGQRDVPDRVVVPEKLYGRPSQVDALRAMVDRVGSAGRTELVLVTGEAGSGKSSIVNEMFGAADTRGLFAAGKFDQYMRDIPYSTLAQAFQKLVRQLLSIDESELASWHHEFDEALGRNGKLILDLIPEMELVIGEQPSLPDLPPQDAQRRFQSVLRRFIGVFARPERPLFLFLDDLQWVDPATLELLDDLLTKNQLDHLLLIGAYRSEEVGPTHVLRQRIDRIRAAGASVEEIELRPLTGDDVERLVVDTLRCDRTRARLLAELLREKTGGNPLFAIQFLQSLEKEGLLVLDRETSTWSWDIAGIRAKGHSDNVVDLMVANLSGMPPQSLAVLRELSCFGAAAGADLIAAVSNSTPEKLNELLREPVRAGLVIYVDETYAFQHDRIREAAYSLVPEGVRAETHLRIARLLLARTPTDERDGVIFQIVGQFNRGSQLIALADERAQVVLLNLEAGRRSKNAAAYGSALTYLAAGQSLLPEDAWLRQPSLIFELELVRAECEFLNGDLAMSENRLASLTNRDLGLVDRAAVACVRIDLLVVHGRPAEALDVGLDFLGGVGFALSPRPPDRDVEKMYDHIRELLVSRTIESLADMPEMADPAICATIEVVNRLVLSAVYQNANLHKLLISLMVDLSIRHGNSPASSVGYVSYGRLLANDFGDSSAAVRFGHLSLALVERTGFETFRSRVFFSFGTGISSWTRHLRFGRDFILKGLDEATRNGDLPYIGYGHSNLIGNLISSGEPLAEIDRAAGEGLDFTRKSGSRIAGAYIIGQLRLIRSLRGLPCDFKTVEGLDFDIDRFEQGVSEPAQPGVVADIYWSRRVQALVYEGNYAAAIEASKHPTTLFRSPWPNIEGAEFHFYSALARAGSLTAAAVDEQVRVHLEAMRADHRQLRALADDCPENFESRATLVGAEIARIEGRELEAELLYAQAIRSARAYRFVQVEALAYECAARSYAARGLDDIAEMYLDRACGAYQTWGADGPLRRLGRPREKAMEPTSPSNQQFDAAAVVKASQALSGEILLPQLIERLMRIAMEHAGAERGLLALVRDGEPQLAAEAVVRHGSIQVEARHTPPGPSDLPMSMMNYAIRTRGRVLLTDAMSDERYSRDEYVRQGRSRSVLCLPILRQTKLVGVLYLENRLVPDAFAGEQVNVLDLLASQAAISLENAGLYSDLQRSETFLAQGQKISHTGSFGWSAASGTFFWSQELYDILEYDRTVVASAEKAIARIHPDDRDRAGGLLERAMKELADFETENRLSMPDGRIKYVHTTGRAVRTENLDFVGSVRDVTERVQSDEMLRQVRNDLAHVARVTTLNAMTASIAHEVSQPLSGILTNANTGARLLANTPPDIVGASETIRRTIRDANRASDVIRRLRALFQNQSQSLDLLDVNEVALEVIALLAGELHKGGATLRTNLARGLPFIRADRVQLQQVTLNLLLNGIEAMVDLQDRPRSILLRTSLDNDGNVRVDIHDNGVGLDDVSREKLFEAFYTTKPNGMGVGLSICRSIIESLDGRLWVEADDLPGTTFSFAIPAVLEVPVEQ